MDKKGVPRIADFGFAVIVKEKNSHSKGNDKHVMSETDCGTTAYKAPEVVEASEDNKYYAKRADVWALGVILYQMLTGRYPYGLKLFKDDGREFVKEAKKKTWKVPADVNLSSEAVDLIGKLLEPDPSKRVKSNHILEHKWFGRGTPSKDS